MRARAAQSVGALVSAASWPVTTAKPVATPPVSQGDARVGGRGEGRGDAGYNLEGKPGCGKGLGLLAGVPEDARIAAFEPYYLKAGPYASDDQRRDRVLFAMMLVMGFADEDHLGVPRRLGQELRSNQPVVEHHIGLAQQGESTDGDQIGAAGSGADEVRFTAHYSSQARRQQASAQ